ncbi:lipid A-modifier LpxR family protein [Roseisalinus antarcticus]|uniref:Lipid A deacylase LpxR family protein n=1 Tax=Roseisalinus antarcticus TaxID=254357 RepID=A0A1Y5TRP8_9RHOB|nr:lipid A-modifier LpxR family protein [Roseisalinus antarcticus]SLN69944.1 hypothetical protein ROA7023_03403 [Roseisalinus antarcticus]
MRRLAPAILLCLGLAGPAAAQGQVTLGFGRIFSNDLFGDGEDRWRTGSYTWSLVRGTGWDGARPETPFDVVDYRFRSEIIAPTRLNGAGLLARPYAGIFAVGLHTHYARGPLDVSLGSDVVFTGPQTRWSDIQAWFHELVDAPRMGVEGAQIEDGTHLSSTAEVAWPLHLGAETLLRPFVEAQAGVEQLVRAGADVLIGEIVRDSLLLRDPVTGHLYRGIEGEGSGFAYVLGADWTRIDDSLYLPEGGRATLEPDRIRLRAGVHLQMGPQTSFFYGATYLSEEFKEQPEGQVTGSLKFNVNF